jgi:hypothetical protein
MPLGLYLTSTQYSLVGSEWSNKSIVHCKKNNIFPRKKNAFFATRNWNDVESYSQMPGKRILALEFSNVQICFRTPTRSFAPLAGRALYRTLHWHTHIPPPVPEILDLPLTTSIMHKEYHTCRYYWAKTDLRGKHFSMLKNITFQPPLAC